MNKFHQLNYKGIPRCFKLLFLCCLFFLCFYFNSISANAMEGNADDDDGGDPTQTVVGGPSWQHTGWLVYIIDESGTQLTDTKVFYSSSATPAPEGGGTLLRYPTTKFGGSTNNYEGGQLAEWDPKPPFSNSGSANGTAVKSFMLQNEYALDFITQHWGASQLEAFKNEKHFLIMEAFYWGQMYNGNLPTGIYLCATAHGWAYVQELQGLGEYGSPRINRYTNNTYPNCVKLEFPQFGYTPGSGKMTNQQIMEGGNGFLVLWANEDIDIDEYEERDELKQLYAIKNWSDEFDISKGIPSGEVVMNAYEADSFFAKVAVETIFSPFKTYNATYSYEIDTVHTMRFWDPDLQDYIEYTYTVSQVVAEYQITFAARASYQILKELEAYSFEKLQVKNDAFAFYPEYTEENSGEWHSVSAEIRRYLANGGYYNGGMYDCRDLGEEHYFLPDTSILEDKTIKVNDSQEAYNRMLEDKSDAMEIVYNASWSRNDHFIMFAGEGEYPFMKDEKVIGCIIPGYYTTSAATSNYRYGGAGLFVDSVKPVKCTGEMEMLIPASTDNLNYPSGATCIYKNIANTNTDKDITLRAGRGVYDGTNIDDIYEHIIDSPNSYGAAHNRRDYPEGDGYDIKVHTPVISPFKITSATGTPQITADEQLIDIDNVDYQLKLDKNYMVQWNLDQWISSNYGELMGYEQNGGFPSRYDEYIEKKEIQFPFDVYYEGVYYEAGNWIEILEPSSYEILWDDGLSNDEIFEYKSNNHWQMMPIYIPSYAQEGSGTINVKVYAHNVEGRYEGSHNVVEAMELTMNTLTSSYIATYNVTCQVSGHIYGFTVTGVDDQDMYKEIDLDKNIWDRIGYSLCTNYEEKVSGTKNRHGENAIRHQKDGSLTYFTQNADNTYSPDYNLLPLRKGSNETAGIHTGDGRLWLGTGFAFNLKTIANLWDDDDYIEITPTFKFYDKNGTLVDTIRIEGNRIKSTNNRLIMLYQEDGVIKDFFNTRNQKIYNISMGDKNFENSYYDTDIHLADDVVKKYGNWVEYTLTRWNLEYHLVGNNAKTRAEMMELAWPCYTNTKITLDKNLRMLSGEWEQLYKNRNHEGLEVATYFDFNEDGYYDENIPEETIFRDSMQTWYGGYCMPGKVMIYDNINNDYQQRTDLSMKDFSTDYEIIINFDIIAYQNGRAHLAYGGMINGGKVWDIEGYDNKNSVPNILGTDYPPFDDGDVVIYRTDKSLSDKLEGHLINVN